MGIRRRTRRLRRWYRRLEHSNGMLAVRLFVIIIAGVGVAALAVAAYQTM
ncbi:hypothetical protein RCH12_000461 [Cryobacterium sp. MP_3.1]|nr:MULTISPECIES: hypothetical protein [Cryobacterium]MEC5183018.1 hypothetical protein [Cryobacterium sp. MP_3.1]